MDMPMTTKRRLSDKFKDSAAPEALPGDKTVLELAARHTIHPTQVTNWKRQAIDGLTGVIFEKEKRAGDIGADAQHCLIAAL